MIERIARAWCVRFHKRITRPINNSYQCLHCLRTYDAWLPEPKADKVTFEIDELERLWKAK